MNLIEGLDYFVRYIPFANSKNPALVTMNEDGTYDIYLNSLCPDEACREGLHHELRHIENEDFYAQEDVKTIEHRAGSKLA